MKARMRIEVFGAKELLTIQEASRFASELTGREVTPANIAYLVQYGRVRKVSRGGVTYVPRAELEQYYRENGKRKAQEWKRKLGEDLNWHLSFEEVPERERTKHVHRLHPYKGKFIPQLVEYFLDEHTDEFKPRAYFHPGDIVLDPFCGSGTTLVQANELGLHAIGIDISFFNVLIGNVKVSPHNLLKLSEYVREITLALKRKTKNAPHKAFERELKEALAEFNAKHFPSPEFKRKVREGKIDQFAYGKEKEAEFLSVFHALAKKYGVDVLPHESKSFLEKWYLPSTRQELLFLRDQILKIEDKDAREVLSIVLSRTARSCRATTHSDLATLVKPVYAPYYCRKHGKICAPLFSAAKWWNYYSRDTLKRLWEFHYIRTQTEQQCVVGDARTIDLPAALRNTNPFLAEVAAKGEVAGIFTSPPYVGMINYHQQHEYAYELFGYERRDEMEIGPLFKGQGAQARAEYVESIARVLKHMKPYLRNGYEIFIVANDKYHLYPIIAEKAGLQIVQEFKRPVLNRTEKNKTPYAESIFHMREK